VGERSLDLGVPGPGALGSPPTFLWITYGSDLRPDRDSNAGPTA